MIPSRPNNSKTRYSVHCSAKSPLKSKAQLASQCKPYNLDHEPLDLVLQAPDLVHQVAGLVGGDAGSDDGSADAAGSAQGGLGGDVDVGDVLVLAEQRQVQEDGEGRGVGGEDDDLGDAAVERLGGLVGTLLQLLVVRCLLDDVEDLLAESCVGRGPGWRRCQEKY